MSRHSSLTLDLNREVSSDQRIKFYEFLKNAKWKKSDNLTTLWYAKWEEGLTNDKILSITKNDLEKAATAANVKHYDASLTISNEPLNTWSK